MKKLFLFLIIGIFVSAVFAQTKTELRPADLSKPITDFITKNFKAFTIEKAFKVDSKGVITYDVLLVHGPDRGIFIFDKDGKFLKRAERGSLKGMNNAQEAKPQPQPGQKPQPADQSKPAPKK